ncbi:nickel-dependent hydrogenase large subunit [Propionivibrio sp.]|uniref:nickel-dependent hydrogenase large subunit n=1 Tax=Propionivibrio sp. TaxID=2212460 RepID=UPI0025D65253|nr:nickel-dependent hydrogenase large subunit [Propionivibrio sp.]MBK8401779.1 nickel-dependent hydrogenase large subunit [Propionivibrio sp.]MBK8744503.1 nickel-dependent hydrogenase large subunit [Propionivibrio sp.]
MNAGIDTGCVYLRLQSANRRVVAAQVRCQRPQVAQLLKGRQADAVVSLLPSVFALCGRAQGTAARLAVAAARGAESAPILVPEIVNEAMREHLWRCLLDLPVLFALPPLRNEFLIAVQRVDKDQGEGLLELLANPEVNRLLVMVEALEQPLAGEPALLCVHSARASLAVWEQLGAEMGGAPTWHGQAAETGAYARRGSQATPVGGAFAERWLARLAELELWATGRLNVGAGGTASAATVAPGIGRALVETARGLLMHEVVLENDRIADYRIVAPTEWNFHPQGALPGWLVGKCHSDDDELRSYAAHAVAALDPCVRWELIMA